MKDGKYGFIYITTNLINGKRYIGQKMYNDKWEDYLGSGILLSRAVEKYGRSNFQREIIEECKNKKHLNEREVYWINYYDATNNTDFYNIAYGGLGGKTKTKKVVCLDTMEVFESIKDATDKYGSSNHNIVNCCNNKFNRNIFNKDDLFVWMWYDEYKKSTNEDIENKIRIAKNTFKIVANGEYYKKINPKDNKNCIKVICLTTNEIFNSIKDAVEKYSNNGISQCCSGLIHYAGKVNNVKLVWMYYDEFLNNKNEVEKRYKNINFQKRQPVKKVKCINNCVIFESFKKAIEWCGLKDTSSITRCCQLQTNYAGKHPITGEKLKWEYVD